MWIEGRIFKAKQGNYWAAEAESLAVHTQGRSKKDAAAMLKDAIDMLASDYGVNLSARVMPGSGEAVFVGCDDNKGMLALLLRRQRQINKLTVRDVAERMGSHSKTAYARYEQGKVEPTLSKLQQLISAINPALKPVFHIA